MKKNLIPSTPHHLTKNTKHSEMFLPELASDIKIINVQEKK